MTRIGGNIQIKKHMEKIMKKRMMVVLALAAMMLVAACGGPKEVSFDTVETARAQAKENAVWNAKTWRSQLYPDWDIISRGDSTQEPNCPQGDGWASIDLIRPDKGKTISLKCSTVSGNIGCLEAVDFKSKSYAQEDGKCADIAKVPFPLPKIAQ